MNFSNIYDLFQQDVDYQSLLQPILPLLKKDEVILDASCGSGHILSYLITLGYRTIGIDNDESMLELAHKKMGTYNLSSNLFLHDLRQPLNHKFHQIISLLDVFHYFKGVKGVIKNLYNALYDGGKLIIDLYNGPQNEIESGTFLDMNYHWQTTTSMQRLIHRITIKKGDITYSYVIKQYLYPVEYYINQLEAAGFKTNLFKGFDDRKVYVLCTK
ncbi:MAG: methyltransferase [Acholeplasma sp.]